MAHCIHCDSEISSCISYTENKVTANCRIENNVLVEDGQVFTNLVEFRCPICGVALFHDGETDAMVEFLRTN